jgi:tetratricopeptide (TPR) repeat protein
MKVSAMLILPVSMFAQQIVLVRPALESTVVWRQVGPNPSVQAPSPLPIPRRRGASEAKAPAPAAVTARAAPPSRYTQCLAAGENDTVAGIAEARAWLAQSQRGGATDSKRGEAAQCLGQLLAQQGDFTGAEAAFAESAGQVAPAEIAMVAAVQTMAGNAALAAGHAESALAWFDKALSASPAKAPPAEENAAFGAVQIDRARALVALGRLPEAGVALEEAHRLAPNDAEGWLLSATLARRGHDLAKAQRNIEVAAGLAPHDGVLAPQIGLEAGVIAVLGGHEAAARKSWESVLALAPGSVEALAARGYLDQLGPAPARAPTPPESPR